MRTFRPAMSINFHYVGLFKRNVVRCAIPTAASLQIKSSKWSLESALNRNGIVVNMRFH